MGILELVAAFKPGGFFFSGKAVNFGTPYYSITIGMNILLTTLICARLYYLRKQVKNVLGAKNAEMYTSLAAIMIESAAPYTIMGIILLPFYTRGNSLAIAFGQVWSKLTVCLPSCCRGVRALIPCFCCAVHRTSDDHSPHCVGKGLVSRDRNTGKYQDLAYGHRGSFRENWGGWQVLLSLKCKGPGHDSRYTSKLPYNERVVDIAAHITIPCHSALHILGIMVDSDSE